MHLIVNIDVPDITQGVDFYCAALGLRLNRMLDRDVAELVGVSTRIYLLENPGSSHPVPSLPIVRDYRRHWTPVHLDFVVEDLATAASTAIDAGAKVGSECIEWLDSKCISFSDPFGNGFCLIEFAAETYASP